MSQCWVNLAFLHWFVPVESVQPHLPAGTWPDVVDSGPYAGLTPVALVPFAMVGAGFGRGPGIPYLGSFWETNVRLYSVDARGRRGIVFCSLDASRLAVVVGARAGLGLPYRWARMRGEERTRDDVRQLVWTMRSRWPGPRGGAGPSDGRGLRSRVAIRIGERVGPDDADTPLTEFLSARWGLHTRHLGRTWYVVNEHATWDLRRAEVLALEDELLADAGFPTLAARPPDHVLFAEGVRTRFGLPAR